MQKSDLDTYLVKYFTGTASAEEKNFVEKWVRQSPQNKEIFEQLEAFWKEGLGYEELVSTESLADHVWEEGRNSAAKNRSTDFNWLRWMKVAAVFLIFISVSFYFYRVVNINQDSHHIEVETKALHKINPAGVKTKVVLDDGTLVYLNSESSISYPEFFQEDKRVIELTGEAFFEVAHDSSRPFIVQTNHITVTALGTSFNVNTLRDDDRIALFTGKVKVGIESDSSGVILKPGEMAVYNDVSQSLKKIDFNDLNVAAWKDGVMVFEGSSFDDFVSTIKRWYGIDIAMEGRRPGDWKLTARYDNESLENVLRNIQFEKDFEFELINKSLTLKFD